METIRSLSLRVFPGRTRSSYALTWRTQRGATSTDRRLYWGTIEVEAARYSSTPLTTVLRLVLNDMERRGGVPSPLRSSPGAPGGGGGVPHAGQGLPGIDPDE